MKKCAAHSYTYIFIDRFVCPQSVEDCCVAAEAGLFVLSAVF